MEMEKDASARAFAFAAGFAAEKGIPRFTRFLDPAQAEKAASEASGRFSNTVVIAPSVPLRISCTPLSC